MFRGTNARRNQYGGVTYRGPPRYDSASDALWQGGPRVGIHATGSGPAERRYEDYQPNLEPNAYSDAPPEIRSVPTPQPLLPPPQLRPRRPYNSYPVPGSGRGRGSSRGGSSSAYRGTFNGRPANQGSAYGGPAQSRYGTQGSNARGSGARNHSSREAGPSLSSSTSISLDHEDSGPSGSARQGLHAQATSAPHRHSTGESHARSVKSIDSAESSTFSRGTNSSGLSHPDSEIPKKARKKAKKAAKALATQESSEGNPKSEPIANANSAKASGSSGSGKAHAECKPKNLKQSSRSGEDENTDRSPVVDTTRAGSSETPKYSKGKAKAHQPDQNRWRYDNADTADTANMRPSENGNAASLTMSSAPQNDRPRWAAYSATREPSQRQPELPALNRWTRNHEAIRSDSSINSTATVQATVSRSSNQPSTANFASQSTAPTTGSDAVASSSGIRPNSHDTPRHDRWDSSPEPTIDQVSKKRRRESNGTTDTPDHRRPKPKFASHITQSQQGPSSVADKPSNATDYRPPNHQQPARPPSMFATTTERSEERSRPAQSSARTAGDAGGANARPRLPTPPVEQRMPLLPSTTFFKKPATSTAFTYSQLRLSGSQDLAISPNGKTVKQVRRINTPSPDSDASSDGIQETDPLPLGLSKHLSAQRSRNTTPLSAGSDYGSARSRPMSSAEMQETPVPLYPVNAPMSNLQDKVEPNSPNGYMTALSTSTPAQTEAQILSSMTPDLSFEVNEKRSDDGRGEDDETPKERQEQQSGAKFIPMPPDCVRGSTSKARLTENRNRLVRAQIIKLENECRVVQRVLWRTDGLALDWVLNRERGIYREFWPVDDCDRSDFAKRVAQRCRSMGGGRTVLSTKKAADTVEVAWLKPTPEVTPAVPEASIPTRKSKASTKHKAATENQSRPTTVEPPPRIRLPPPPKIVEDTSVPSASVPADQDPDASPQSTLDAEVDECLKQSAKWWAIRATAKDEVHRAFAQEQMDRYAKEIENIYARKTENTG